MLIATESIVRAAESIHRDFEVAKLKAYQSRPGNPNRIAFAMFGNTVAALGPYVGYFNRVYGFADAQIPALPDIVDFYAETRTDFELTVSPLDASREVGRALVDHGFTPGGYHAKFFADPVETSPATVPSDIAVSPVDKSTLDTFLDTMLEGWGLPREHWEGARENMRLRFGIPGAFFFLGHKEGRNIGGGVLYMREGDAYLADAATVPSERGQGCQIALMRARIAKANASGCKRLFGCAHFGNPSFRNMQRAGLRLASCDATWHYQFARP